MVDVSWVVSTIISNPQVAAVILIQFILGLALGYTAVKALKYILAIVAILALGAVLSVWSLGITPREVLNAMGVTIESVKNLVMLLGLTTMGPVTLGFFVGVIVSLLRK